MYRFLVAFLATIGALSAATIPQMEFSEVVERSPRIVQGRVTRTWAAWDAAHKAIWTHAEIAVSRDLRGNAGATVVISELGGVVDGIEMHAPGAPKLRVGEDAVLFAYETPGGLWRLRGWGQGKYRIERDSSGAEVVRRESFGATLVKPSGAPVRAAQTVGDTPDSKVEPLDDFLLRVETLLSQEANR